MANNEVRIRLAVDGGAQVKDALSSTDEQLQRLNTNLVKTAHYGAGLLVLVPTLHQMAAGFVTAADAVTTLRSRLVLATGSTEKASAAFESLFLIAQNSRTSFTELGATFATIARAGQALGLSQERLLGVTGAIGNAMAISGGSAQGMQAALVQLGQGLASGTLRGEELNSVMEQAPRLAKALADGMGVPIGQLRKLGEQGEITSQMVIAALEKSAPQLAKELSSATLTVGQSFTMLSNSATKFVGEADAATGASGTLAGALKGIAGALDSVGETIRKHDTTFAIIGGTLAGAATVAGVIALGKGLVLLAGGIGAVGLAVAALNPVTLAILGVGAVTGGVMAASSAYDKTAGGIKRLISQLEGADTELLRLRAALVANPGNIILGGQVRELERDTVKRTDAVRALRQQLALLSAPTAGSVAEDARLDRGTQSFVERTQRATALTEVMSKLSGVNADFGKHLNALHASYAAGDTTLAAYREQVAALIDKEGGGKEMLAKLKAARAKEATGGNPFAAEQDAAKVWAKAIEDAADITAKAAAETNGWSAAQRKLIAYLTSPAYQINGATMRDLAESNLRAGVAAERDAEAHKAWAEARKKAYADVASAHDREVQAAMGSAEAVAKTVQGMKDEEGALLMAAALNISLAQAVERVQIARLQERADVARASGNQELLDQLNAEMAARRALATLTDRKAARTSLGADVGGQLGDGFDKASQSLSAFVNGFAGLVKLQDDYNAARKAAAGDATLQGQIDAKNVKDNVRGYATLAGAAKGFFKEGTTGHKLMAGAEKAFRAVEMAMAIESALVKVGLIGTVAAASVAGQAVETSGVVAGEAARNTAKVPGVFMAFMSALGPWGMAAAGVAIAAVLGGAFSGGGGAAPVTNTGTGTVFGDAGAQSDSVAKAIKSLEDVDTMTMRYSAQMLDALRNIEASIGGLTNLILRAGGVDAAAAGIDTGFKQNIIGKLLTGDGSVGIGAVLGGIGGFLTGGPLGAAIGAALGGLLNPILGKLFGSKTSITGQGITAAPQTLGSIAAGGMVSAGYYADTQTKSKFLGVTYNTSNGTRRGAPDAELNQQFSLIFAGFNAAMQAAAGPLGVALDAVNGRLSSFVVDIGNIDLKGLTGTQIQEKLTAVFGAAGDRIAQAVLPGLGLFQKVGEGYFETVARVAVGIETAQSALERLGIAAVGFADLANKQGDVGAEIVRQSLVATTTGGIRAILQLLGGSAGDLVDAYTALTGVRRELVAIGVSGAAVSAALLQGAGGLQALQDSIKSYREKFLTDAQRLAINTADVTAAFSALGLALPGSAKEFVGLVQGIDTSTAAGQKLLGRVLALSDGFAVLTDHAKEAVNALSNAGEGIAAFIAELRGAMGGSAGGQDAARAAYAADLAGAQGGDAAASGRVVASAKALVEAVRNNAADPLDLARQTSAIAVQLQALPAVVSWQATMLEKLDQLGSNAAAGSLTLNGTVAVVAPGLTDAVAGLADATNSFMDMITGRPAAAAEPAQYGWRSEQYSEGDSGELTRWAWGPLFANGGSHAGGLRIVGENGPELEATGASRIWTARQTADMVAGSGSNAATVAELQALRAELRAGQEAITAATQAMAKQLARWDDGGAMLTKVTV